MKEFGHKRPRRNPAGEIIDLIDCPARAVTRNPCGFGFGPDSKRKLIVSLEAGDLIVVRPHRTARPYRMEARDLFRYLLQLEANRLNLERARDRKARKAARLAAQRQARAEKRLLRKDPQ